MFRVLPVCLGEGLWVSNKRIRQYIGFHRGAGYYVQ